MHTIFRIWKIQQIGDRLWKVYLRSTSDNDEQLARLTEYIRERTNAPTELHRLGSLMFIMGEYEKAEEIFNALAHYQQSLNIDLTYLPPNAHKLARNYIGIGLVFKEQKDLDGALEQFQRSLELELCSSQPNQLNIATHHNNIGGILDEQGKYNEALHSYKCTLEIELAQLPHLDPSLACTITWKIP